MVVWPGKSQTMAENVLPPASRAFVEHLRKASSSNPEYAVWAAVLESPLSDSARLEIEAVLANAVSEGLETLNGGKMASIMERLAEILERERAESAKERSDAQSALESFFRFFN